MASLSKGRGWSEDFIRWQLPPWRGHAILHSDLVLAGHECVWADIDNDPDNGAFDAMRARLTGGK